MHSRPRVLWFSFFAVLVVGGIVLTTSQTLQRHYHLWRMRSEYLQAYTGEKTIHDGFVVVHLRDRNHNRYDFHRQKLVAMGVICEREYAFRNVRIPTEESKTLCKRILSLDCPPFVDFAGTPYSVTSRSVPLQLTVWCWPVDVAAWDDFVAANDKATLEGSATASGSN